MYYTGFGNALQDFTFLGRDYHPAPLQILILSGILLVNKEVEMSGKLFGQIVLLMIIGVLILMFMKCAMLKCPIMGKCIRGSCPISQTFPVPK